MSRHKPNNRLRKTIAGHHMRRRTPTGIDLLNRVPVHDLRFSCTLMTRRISEPTLPEHELIRAAGELPDLSSGFRDATLTICQAEVVRARRIQRTKFTAVAMAACGLLLAITASFFISRSDHAVPMAHDDASSPSQATPASTSPSSGGEVKNPPGVLSAGSPGDDIPLPTEAQQYDRLIEDAGRRSRQLIDAGMIPGL